MAVFTIEVPDGRKLDIEAADEATALRGAQEWVQANPKPPTPGRPWEDANVTQLRGGPGRTADPRSALPGVLGDAQNATGSLQSGLVDTMTFGFGDELMAGLATPIEMGLDAFQGKPLDIGRSYGQALTTMRRGMDETGALNPGAHMAGQVAGAFVNPMGSMSMMGKVPMLAKPLVGAAEGAVGGGLYGFGSGDTMDQRLTGARDGALVGAAVGGAAPLVMGAAGRMFGGRVPREARNLSRALADDNIDPATINQQLQQLGPDAMVMDLGPNLQRQAGALASIPGPAQKAVRDAVAQRGGRRASQRVADDVTATVGNGPDIEALTQHITQRQRQAADPLYAAVRNVQVKPTGNLRFVFQTPMGKRALKRARELAQNDGLPVQPGTVQLFDYAKQALDEIATAARRTGTNSHDIRQAANLAGIIRREVDAQVPDYQRAREAFAGPAQVLDAIEAGQQVFSKDMTPYQLASTLKGMTRGQVDAFIRGAQSNVAAMMGNAVNDVAGLRNWLKKGWNEQKLRILLGDDVADDLLQRVERELRFGQTSNVVVGNSETAGRTAAQKEVAPEMHKTPHTGLSVLGLFPLALDWARKRWMAFEGPRANSRLADVLTARQLPRPLMQQAQRANQRPPTPYGGLGIQGAVAEERGPVEITIFGGAQ